MTGPQTFRRSINKLELIPWQSTIRAARSTSGALSEGVTTALRQCLERIAPPRKDSEVVLELPLMRFAAGVAQAILRAVSQGELTPLEVAAVMNLVEGFRRILELSEYEGRIMALERALLGARS